MYGELRVIPSLCRVHTFGEGPFVKECVRPDVIAEKLINRNSCAPIVSAREFQLTAYYIVPSNRCIFFFFVIVRRASRFWIRQNVSIVERVRLISRHIRIEVKDRLVVFICTHRKISKISDAFILATWIFID